jgi:hypothetical protein
MALPLFDPPPAPAAERIGVPGTPEFAAYTAGFRDGSQGHSKTFRYDPDDRVNQYYVDGFRIGRLFRPVPLDGA